MAHTGLLLGALSVIVPAFALQPRVSSFDNGQNDSSVLGLASAPGPEMGVDVGHRPIQVVVMIMTAPHASSWRQMVRRHWGEVAGNVTVIGHNVDIVMKFAVGKAADPIANMQCRREASKHGDMAILKVMDGRKKEHSSAQHYGKIWYLFKWALDNYPKADLYFKQDDDSIVNWRIALPLMLERVWRPPAKLPFERLYMGRLQYEVGYPCGMGELYGFSKDIVTFGTAFTKPMEYTEDVFTCEWTRGMDQWIEPKIDRGGLLSWPSYENAWIHPVKEQHVYEQCFKDGVQGCQVQYPWGDRQNISFRVLPSLEAAKLFRVLNSTATQEQEI
mmetsp:Transcript_2823/g.6605  ORF Transcript_2823/g.6605 Transcript_2823/m.6605 type:complete len:331 (+) Transcript_2823:52-1044(+)